MPSRRQCRRRCRPRRTDATMPAKSSSRFTIWSGSSARSRPSITSASKCAAARFWACSGPTAPARPRRSACCADCCGHGGTLRVAGVDSAHARASARQRIGYVAQKFSLYGQLSVAENLEFFASAYGLRGGRRTRAHRLGAASSSS